MANEAKRWPSETAPRWPPVGTWVQLMEAAANVCLWRGAPVIGPFTGLDRCKRPCIHMERDTEPEKGWRLGGSWWLEAIPAEEVVRLQLGTLDGL